MNPYAFALSSMKAALALGLMDVIYDDVEVQVWVYSWPASWPDAEGFSIERAEVDGREFTGDWDRLHDAVEKQLRGDK